MMEIKIILELKPTPELTDILKKAVNFIDNKKVEVKEEAKTSLPSPDKITVNHLRDICDRFNQANKSSLFNDLLKSFGCSALSSLDKNSYDIFYHKAVEILNH